MGIEETLKEFYSLQEVARILKLYAAAYFVLFR